MIEKVDLKHLLYIGIACMAINFLFVGCGKSSTINQLQTDTDRTMGTIKAESAIVGVEVGRTEESMRELTDALERSRIEFERSRASGKSIKASLDELERIIGESEELAKQNARIINNIDQAN